MPIEVTNGASVTSKGPSRVLTNLRMVRSFGNKVELEDGRVYIDWQMGLHGALYGYRPPWWVDALRDAIDAGPASSIACKDERIVAEMLGEFYPDIEAVRFLVNGSDPCAAAVKIARHVTGRDKLLVYGYHGTASCYCSPPEIGRHDNRLGTIQAERDAFVPLEWLGEYGNLGEIAAVVVECPPSSGGQFEARTWLSALVAEAHKAGALFVLDEVITGFRYGPSGASGRYELRDKVDLYAFGKTLGNGYPVACLAGRKVLMDELADRPDRGKVHWSGTFAGEPLGMAVAKAFLQQLSANSPWGKICELGAELQRLWNERKPGGWEIIGHPTRPKLIGKMECWQEFQKYMFHRGHIFFAYPMYCTYATDYSDIEQLVNIASRWKRSPWK